MGTTPKIVYLTGAPATGKSTLANAIGANFPSTRIFTYSKELLSLVRERDQSISSQDDLRRGSANMITRRDVDAMDQRLLALADECRGACNLIIDSHPVTVEEYGFRITPFSKQQISKLNPDVIICLYASPEVITSRIQTHPAGRPLGEFNSLQFHATLQAIVANQYSFESSRPLYFLDSGCSNDNLLQAFLKVTRIS